jgi:hypothetical protein
VAHSTSSRALKRARAADQAAGSKDELLGEPSRRPSLGVMALPDYQHVTATQTFRELRGTMRVPRERSTRVSSTYVQLNEATLRDGLVAAGIREIRR